MKTNIFMLKYERQVYVIIRIVTGFLFQTGVPKYIIE